MPFPFHPVPDPEARSKPHRPNRPQTRSLLRQFGFAALLFSLLVVSEETRGSADRTTTASANYEALNAAAVEAIGSGDWKAAFIDLNQAIALQPERPDAYFIYGRAHVMREEYPAAEQAFAKVLEIDPTLSSACYELAQLMVRKDDLDTAIDYSKKTVSLTGGRSWKYLTFLGELYAEAGNRVATEETFDRAIGILDETCMAIQKAIVKREREEEVVDTFIGSDFYTQYDRLIEYPTIRVETRQMSAPSEWDEDLARMQRNLAAVTARKGEVLAWMDAR